MGGKSCTNRMVVVGFPHGFYLFTPFFFYYSRNEAFSVKASHRIAAFGRVCYYYYLARAKGEKITATIPMAEKKILKGGAITFRFTRERERDDLFSSSEK